MTTKSGPVARETARGTHDHAASVPLIPSPLSWLWLVGMVALAVLVVFAFKMLMVLFAGVMVALVLRAPSLWLSRVLHVPYGVALALMLVVVLGSATLLVVLAAPTIAEQWQSLTQELPKTVTQVRQKLERLPLVAGAQQQQHAGQGNQAKGLDVAGMIVSTLGGSLEVLSGLVIAFFIGVYGAAQPASYRRAALLLASRADRERIEP